MAEINVELHPAQLEIFNSNARFKIVAAGRRFGKSRLAAWILLIKALQSKSKDVFYVGPTFQQSKDIMWGMLKELGADVIQDAYENTARLTLINGRNIYLKGYQHGIFTKNLFWFNFLSNKNFNIYLPDEIQSTNIFSF